MSEVDVDVYIPLKAFLKKYQKLIKDIRDNPGAVDIELLYGGRDSGKSRFVASVLVALCLQTDFYFRCVLARKVFNTIKDSQWQTIKDVAEFWQVDHLFAFNVSPLEIRCLNGNRFICRGFDEPGKIKSLMNVNIAWVEEGNQLVLTDFITLLSTLRSNNGKVKTFFTFNPEAEGDYEEFWLYKTFYEPYKGDIYSDFTYTWDIPVTDDKGTVTVVKFVYRSTHSTYHDNNYCSSTRKAFLEQIKVLDPYYYQVFTKGKWGNAKVGDPFCLAFDKVKHGIKKVEPTRSLELYLSFDFNVNPITCGVYQHFEQPNGRMKIKCVRSIKLANSDIYKLCDHIKLLYPAYTYLITGDATGQNTSALVQDGINYYTVIREKFDLAPPQIKVPTINPKVSENRVLVNAAFTNADVEIDPDNGKDLIFDCQFVTVDDMGKIDKGDRANPKKRADHLDHFRYYLNTFHKSLLRM